MWWRPQDGSPSAEPVDAPGPSAAEPDPGQEGLRRRRLRDGALIMTLAGAFMLLPPFIRVFAAAASPWGIPLIVLYLFGVWAALILGCFLLARRLDRTGDEE